MIEHVFEKVPALPDAPSVFEGTDAERFLALSLEALVHDVSLSGDRDVALGIADYLLGEAEPPEAAPTFVEQTHDGVRVSDPPFLHAEVRRTDADPPGLRVAFDSDLGLLIEPPVVVRFDGPLTDAVADLEQTVAEIYRTRGRHLESLDEE